MPQTDRGYRRAAARIRQLIAEMGLQTGARLPGEIALSKICGVSRPVIRQAIIMLEIRGDIQVRAGVRAVVGEKSEPLLTALRGDPAPLEIFGARLTIEGEVAAAAALNASAGDLEGIQRIHAKMKMLMDAKEDTSVADREFHMLLGRAAKSNVLASLVGSLWISVLNQPQGRMAQLSGAITQQAKVFDEHQEIYRAVATRNPVEARRAMRRHLDHTREAFRSGAGLTHSQSFNSSVFDLRANED
jgi:DNA-binding FadR family transcriptional regulator